MYKSKAAESPNARVMWFLSSYQIFSSYQDIFNQRIERMKLHHSFSW